MIGLKIAGTGHYLPNNVISNSDLEKMVDTTDEWIKTRSGIEYRHQVDPEQTTSDIGVIAAQQALMRANCQPQNIDLVLFGTSTPDYLFPSTAALLQHKLGLRTGIAAFDFNIACSSFPYGLVLAYHLLQSGVYRRILLVLADVLTKITDYTDRSTCVLLGDGASALVLEAVNEDQNSLLSFDLGIDGSVDLQTLYVPAGGSARPASFETVQNKEHCFRMDGAKVYVHAIERMSRTILNSMEKINFISDDIDFVIPHQANIRIMNRVLKELSIPSTKLINTIAEHGNTSGSTVGIALDKALRSGQIQPGDCLAFTAFGAGFSWGSAIIRI